MSREVWTYWISRDSLNGEPTGECGLWWVRPTRVQHRYRITWVPSDLQVPGYLGAFPLEHILAWFRVTPDTDLQLIKVEQWSTEGDKA